MPASFNMDTLFGMYKKSGLLTRTNDGQTPTTPDMVMNAIKQVKINTDPSQPFYAFSSVLQNQAPPYSSSLLSGSSFGANMTGASTWVNSPVLWYNFAYSEAFKQSTTNPIGSRTVVAAVFSNKLVQVAGGFAWDADSNLRNMGNIPATRGLNRCNPNSLYAQLNAFEGIADFTNSPPNSLNNHAFYNPLFYPRTANLIQPYRHTASTGKEVAEFLNMIGAFKSAWVARLKKEAGGFNRKFANYVNSVYQTGVEPEILIEPKEGDQAYYQRKFSTSSILCLAFFTDGKQHGTHSLKEYQKTARAFMVEATGDQGWISPGGGKFKLRDMPPLVSVTGVALPDVPLAGTEAAGGNIGAEWCRYLNDFCYDSALKRKNFKLIL